MATTTWIDADPVAADDDAVSDGAATDKAVDLRRHVLDRLNAEGWRFDFFQAAHLLERAFEEFPQQTGSSSEFSEGRIKIRPDNALTFPATDVRRIRLMEGAAEMDVTFMGLYGVSSPLPSYFSESVTAPSEASSPLRSFLDIFSHRIYSYFYRAWKKCRPELSRREDGRDRHTLRFLSLTGLAGANTLDPERVSRSLLMTYAGRLMPRSRNAEGLRAIVAAALSMPVDVVENVPRWVPIRQRPKMGRGGGMSLGSTATIGERLYDIMGKLRIRLGPMDADDYLSLLPGGRKAGTMKTLTRTYVPGYLDYDVELRLNPGCLRASQLGDSTSRLGYTASLGTTAASTLSRIVRFDNPAA